MIRKTAATMLFAIAVPAAAQTASEPAAKPKAEKKLCRRMEETGSIMGGKSTCHTKAEWAAIDDANNSNAAASRDTRGVAGNARGM